MLETALSTLPLDSTDSETILPRVDVRLLEASPGDSGWDVFTLDYHVQGPLSPIFNESAKQVYSSLFVFLWRLKRVDHALTSVRKRFDDERWRYVRGSKLLKTLSRDSKASQALHFCQL